MLGKRMVWAVFVIASLGAVTVVGGGASAQPGPGDFAVRDQLIAAQENLLNTYRCLFNVDVDVVPGRCPNPDTVFPGVAPANPTQHDLVVRDELIADQEALLNGYRCYFGIDTHIVPDGCSGSGTPENGAGLAEVTYVRLFRGAGASGCEIRDVGDDDNCSWLDIDVDFTDGVLPAYVYLECRGIVYEARGGFAPRGVETTFEWGEVTLSSSREALSYGTETELDQFCRYGNSGESVYVVVDGVASNELVWDDRTSGTDPQLAAVEWVEIFAGGDAADVDCLFVDAFDHCHWIDIDVGFTTLAGALPFDVFVECFAVDVDGIVYRLAGQWVELVSSEGDLAVGANTELDRVCGHGWSGDEVFVEVDGVPSPNIVWAPHG